MVKVLLFFGALLFYAGGCEMTGRVADAPSVENQKLIESRILEHAKNNYSLNADAVDLREVKPENLPAGTRLFYLEKKKSYGNIFYNYLISGDRLYSSGDEADFGKFLKDTDFLAKKNLNAVQFWAVYKSLNFTFPTAILIDREAIEKPSNSLKPLVNQVAAPDLKFGASDAVFIFYIKDTNLNQFRKYAVNVASDYRVSVDYAELKAE